MMRALLLVAVLLLAGCSGTSDNPAALSGATSDSASHGTGSGTTHPTTGPTTGTSSSSGSSTSSGAQGGSTSSSPTSGGGSGGSGGTAAPSPVSASCELVVDQTLSNSGKAACAPANFTSNTGAAFSKAGVTLTYTNQVPAAPPATSDVTLNVFDSAGKLLGSASGASPISVTLTTPKLPQTANFHLTAQAVFGVVVSTQGQGTFSGSAAFALT